MHPVLVADIERKVYPIENLGGTMDYNDGEGVPMIFDGRFLVRGSTVTIP